MSAAEIIVLSGGLFVSGFLFGALIAVAWICHRVRPLLDKVDHLSEILKHR